MRTANVSNSLVWSLVRNYNSQQVRRHNGFVSTTFSKERGNLLNFNSPKYSALANSQTVNVQRSGNSFSITVRRRRQVNRPNSSILRIVQKNGNRKQKVANATRGVSRTALKTAAARRWNRLYTNNRKQLRRRAQLEKTKSKKNTETKNVNDVN